MRRPQSIRQTDRQNLSLPHRGSQNKSGLQCPQKSVTKYQVIDRRADTRCLHLVHTEDRKMKANETIIDRRIGSRCLYQTEDRGSQHNREIFFFVVKLIFHAPVLYAGHASLVSSYGSSVRELTTLCHRSSRACSSCCHPEGMFLCTFDIDTAVCGQRAEALPSLVAGAPMLLCTCRVGTAVWYIYLLAPGLSP